MKFYKSLSYSLLMFMLCLSVISSTGQSSLKGYQFYERGEEITFEEAVEALSKADVILFGELHNHTMVHWLQLKTAQKLLESTDLIMGAEFFETDDQLLLNELVAGLTPMKKFEDEAKLWPNYETDYRPILQLAVDSQITFIGTNIPRRYASFVSNNGLDTLETFPEESLSLIPPLPMPFSMETPGYQEVYDMMSGGHGMPMSPENFVRAQAVKDYTMAYNIGENMKKKSTFLHFNGDFHSKDFGGVYWYLNELYPKLKVNSIKVIEVEDFDMLTAEDLQGGDIILAVPVDFAKSY